MNPLKTNKYNLYFPNLFTKAYLGKEKEMR